MIKAFVKLVQSMARHLYFNGVDFPDEKKPVQKGTQAKVESVKPSTMEAPTKGLSGPNR